MLRTGRDLLLLTALCGCQDEEAPPPPDTRPPEQVVDAVLERCHGILRGADKMDSSVVELRRQGPEDEPETVILGKRGRMRRTFPDRRIEVRLAKGAFRVTPGGEVEPMGPEGTDRLDRFQALVRAALLAPLYGATRMARRGEMIELVQPDGAMWHLRCAPKRIDGEWVRLPAWLSGPPGELTFLEHLHTGVTHLPKKVRLGEFGEYLFALKASDVAFGEGVFTDPRGPAGPAPAVPTQDAANPPKGVPVVQRIAGRRALVFPDPGTWEGRIAALMKRRLVLVEQGQRGADLDFLFDEDGTRMLAMPFEMQDKPFVARNDQRVLRLPPHTAVVLYPERGSLAECEAAARARLEAFVAEQGLTKAGPLRIVPYVDPTKGPPTPEEAAGLTVRFELPVRR